MSEVFNMITENLFNIQEFSLLLFRFFINTFFAYIVIDRIYYRINKQREFLFTFFIFNILIFFVSSLLSDVKMKTGFAFGLFAIFSILRYRTEPINIKEMTFLFTSIILAVINSMVTIKVSLISILFADIILTISVYILEKMWLESYSKSMKIIYENIDLVNESTRKQLTEDIKTRTGLAVHHYEISEINYLRDTAKITIFYD